MTSKPLHAPPAPPLLSRHISLNLQGTGTSFAHLSTSSSSSSPSPPDVPTPPPSTPLSPLSPELPGPVKETNHILKNYDPVSGRKVINRYEIIKELGRGVHGKVKLARVLPEDATSATGYASPSSLSTPPDENDPDTEYVAIKIVDRAPKRRQLGKSPSLDNGQTPRELGIRREIAIMKKCVHPNVVRLREVIDDSMSKKIYLVLEYMDAGEIVWRTVDEEPALTQEQARRVFRDVVLGLEYLHYQGIVHRDIKPANLLRSTTNIIKISDFGVSHLSQQQGGSSQDDAELAKTAGTPAFFAPELCFTDLGDGRKRPPVTKAIDIWSLGVTLFCLLFGKCPFTGESEFDLFRNIAEEELVIPEHPHIDDEARDLLVRLLEKDPQQRITLEEVKRHPWVLRGIPDPTRWLEETDPTRAGAVLEVSQEEVDSAVGIVDKLKKKLFKLGTSFGWFGSGLRRRATTAAPGQVGVSKVAGVKTTSLGTPIEEKRSMSPLDAVPGSTSATNLMATAGSMGSRRSSNTPIASARPPPILARHHSAMTSTETIHRIVPKSAEEKPTDHFPRPPIRQRSSTVSHGTVTPKHTTRTPSPLASPLGDEFAGVSIPRSQPVVEGGDGTGEASSESFARALLNVHGGAPGSRRGSRGSGIPRSRALSNLSTDPSPDLWTLNLDQYSNYEYSDFSPQITDDDYEGPGADQIEEDEGMFLDFTRGRRSRVGSMSSNLGGATGPRSRVSSAVRGGGHGHHGHASGSGSGTGSRSGSGSGRGQSPAHPKNPSRLHEVRDLEEKLAEAIGA
ncbi:hypothetical protein YB2330_002921 [Saitoella coloradoensis]